MSDHDRRSFLILKLAIGRPRVVILGKIVSRVNRTVRFDPQSEQIAGDDEANALTKRNYRNGHWARLSRVG